MPSPFPGMDPYLENPTLWPDVHHELISVAREMLLAALRPRYFVQIDERLYVATDDEEKALILPDMSIRQLRSDVPSTGSATAVAIEPGIEADPRLRIDVREARLRVIDRNNHRVVTVLEILSPANKKQGSAGRAEYERKKQEVVSSETNLVEIDLLRAGVPLLPHRVAEYLQYIAQVWRWTGDSHHRLFWPMPLEKRLKVIPVPVRLGDADAQLDLQAMLNTAYDRAAYELLIDYRQEPVPPLPPNAAKWAKEVIDKHAPKHA